ncbi:SGNH/GDSL hydrolase family protein [Clostridium oryzae]|uniref:GDSL-like lipase/acylhydrolase n=1 Tax=Clostridium oryzae TaxID=1450648 RepID=A0A1V4IP50_9CLOT|nr:SGNH/GDSL hydrolase family protein [Clostridium oryzae]OPJ61659.1 GDSL-like lipase/acylhydrolase [Clostridium oryzae]
MFWKPKVKFFQTCFTLLLLTLILFVVIAGNNKLRENTSRLKIEANKIEEENKQKAEAEEKKLSKAAKQQEDASKDITYKGSTVIGSADENRWKNKNWLALGDNITYKLSYQSNVKVSLGMNKVTTDASIGRLMKDSANDVNASKVANEDLITVFAGTADYSLNTPLGTVKDDENTKTFYGALYRTINKLIKLKPDATIAFFTPLKRGAYSVYPVYPAPNRAGVTLGEYAEAIENVCKSYNILVLNLFDESGINRSNISSYTVDGLHLNEAGSRKVSTCISDYLKKIE